PPHPNTSDSLASLSLSLYRHQNESLAWSPQGASSEEHALLRPAGLPGRRVEGHPDGLVEQVLQALLGLGRALQVPAGPELLRQLLALLRPNVLRCVIVIALVALPQVDLGADQEKLSVGAV